MADHDLTPWQLAGLARAAARTDGSLPPPGDAAAFDPHDDAAGLIAAGLVREIAVIDPALGWRFADETPIGIIITDLGRMVVETLEEEIAPMPTPTSKIGRVIEALGRSDGTTLSELGAITGWQPHSVRAALTTLRKKGLVIVRSAGTDARYRIQEA